MNERIFDMARQSGATDEQGGHSQEVFCFTKSELSAFAELIVRECCVVMFADPRLRDVRTATRGCARSIKEHFGVEE